MNDEACLVISHNDYPVHVHKYDMQELGLTLGQTISKEQFLCIMERNLARTIAKQVTASLYA